MRGATLFPAMAPWLTRCVLQETRVRGLAAIYRRLDKSKSFVRCARRTCLTLASSNVNPRRCAGRGRRRTMQWSCWRGSSLGWSTATASWTQRQWPQLVSPPTSRPTSPPTSPPLRCCPECGTRWEGGHPRTEVRGVAAEGEHGEGWLARIAVPACLRCCRCCKAVV